MLNFFNNNILPASEELQRILDEKVRADAEIEAAEAKALKAEQDGCDA